MRVQHGRKNAVLPNATCTFTVGFLPTTSGTLFADLVIATNDPKNLERSVPLSGSGGQRRRRQHHCHHQRRDALLRSNRLNPEPGAGWQLGQLPWAGRLRPL